MDWLLLGVAKTKLSCNFCIPIEAIFHCGISSLPIMKTASIVSQRTEGQITVAIVSYHLLGYFCIFLILIYFIYNIFKNHFW